MVGHWSVDPDILSGPTDRLLVLLIEQIEQPVITREVFAKSRVPIGSKVGEVLGPARLETGALIQYRK
jgi:hypothetical protein